MFVDSTKEAQALKQNICVRLKFAKEHFVIPYGKMFELMKLRMNCFENMLKRNVKGTASQHGRILFKFKHKRSKEQEEEGEMSKVLAQQCERPGASSTLF